MTLAYLGIALMTFLISIVFHEWGHYLAAKHYNAKPKLVFLREGIVPSPAIEYEDLFLKKDEGLTILAAGFLIGMIPLAIFFMVSQSLMSIIWLMVAYLWISVDDLKKMIKMSGDNDD